MNVKSIRLTYLIPPAFALGLLWLFLVTIEGIYQLTETQSAEALYVLDVAQIAIVALAGLTLLAILYSLSIRGLSTLSQADVFEHHEVKIPTVAGSHQKAQVINLNDLPPTEKPQLLKLDLSTAVNRMITEVERTGDASRAAVEQVNDQLTGLAAAVSHMGRVIDKCVTEIDGYNGLLVAMGTGDLDDLIEAAGAIHDPNMLMIVNGLQKIRTAEAQQPILAGLKQTTRRKIRQLEYWRDQYKAGVGDIMADLQMIDQRGLTLLVESDRARITRPIAEAKLSLATAEQQLRASQAGLPALALGEGPAIVGL